MIDKYKTLGEMVYREIRNMIINGEFEPGQPLVASRLSEELGTSIIPVREAIRQLENEGLVNVIPHKGATVSTYDIEDIQQIYEVRKLLESRAARLAAQNISDETIDYLESTLVEMEKSLDAQDYRGYSEANDRFHRAFYECSGNKWLCRVIFELWDKTRRSNAAVKSNLEHRRRMFEQHRSLIKALRERRDPGEIEAMTVRHVETAMQGVLEYVRSLETQTNQGEYSRSPASQ